MSWRFWRHRPAPIRRNTEDSPVSPPNTHAPEPLRREREKVSFDWIHEQLETAFQELTKMIPRGSEEVLIADYLFMDEWHLLRTERTPMKLLEDFAQAVHQLQKIRRSAPHDIRIFLENEIAQAVLMEDSSWTQKYLD